MSQNRLEGEKMKIVCTVTRYAVIFGAMFLLTACGGGGGSSSVQAPQTEQIASLQKGECFSPVVDSSYVMDVEVKPCSEGTKYQVAGRITLKDSVDAAYPGHVELDKRIYDECESVFEAFTGLTFWSLKHGLDIETVAPSLTGWNDGDREGICLISKMDGSELMTSVEVVQAE